MTEEQVARQNRLENRIVTFIGVIPRFLKPGQSSRQLGTALTRRLCLCVACQRNREDAPVLTATALIAAAVETQQPITVTQSRATKLPYL
jgi:hypothetical protein